MPQVEQEIDSRTAGIQQFDDDYYAALDPSLQAAVKLTLPARIPLILKAQATGLLIDADILLGLGALSNGAGTASGIMWGAAPWLTHLSRTHYGIPYVGSFEGMGTGPNKSPMGVDPMKWATPPGALPTVYFDANDIPATITRLHVLYPPPAPLPPTPPAFNSQNIVGNYIGGGFYIAGPGAKNATLASGMPATAPDGVKVYAVIMQSSGLMDPKENTPLIYFTRVKPSA